VYPHLAAFLHEFGDLADVAEAPRHQGGHVFGGIVP
jgi:hypothetical protein